MEKQLDDIDRILLNYLQADARVTNTELARQVNLSPPGLQKRLQKLEEMGVVEGYVTLVNREALGYDMLCFVQVTLKHHETDAVSSFRDSVRALPEVLDCYFLTGEYDYLLRVILRNRRHLEEFLLEKLTPLVGMDKIRTSLVLSEIKYTTAVPVFDDLNKLTEAH